MNRLFSLNARLLQEFLIPGNLTSHFSQKSPIISFKLSFRENGKHKKNVDKKIPALRAETRDCSPRPVDTECAAQERAILRRDFTRSATGKTHFISHWHWLSPPKHPVWV